jgi:mRNA interferase RelE/StbE
VKSALETLSTNPRPSGAVKLKGSPPVAWRIRVGEHRIVYEVQDDDLLVIAINIAPRGEVYR